MSSFIVADKTINQIVTFLNVDSSFRYMLKDLGYDLFVESDLERLASDLYLMNCDAVDCRYGKGTSAHDTVSVDTFQFSYDPYFNECSIYKSIQCFLYQCSEGDVKERKLYDTMKKVKAIVAHRIIEKLPEYKSAQWE